RPLFCTNSLKALCSSHERNGTKQIVVTPYFFKRHTEVSHLIEKLNRVGTLAAIGLLANVLFVPSSNGFSISYEKAIAFGRPREY
ncbi:MAG: hypothetical protein KDE09_00275, partial [Anaerolineales bacterium]|nr:hypothetical protein [Anaerolineales bacterium]